MGITQGVFDGFVHTEIRGHGAKRYCHLWLTDETNKESIGTTAILDVGCCRNVAEILIGRARELEEVHEHNRSQRSNS